MINSSMISLRRVPKIHRSATAAGCNPAFLNGGSLAVQTDGRTDLEDLTLQLQIGIWLLEPAYLTPPLEAKTGGAGVLLSPAPRVMPSPSFRSAFEGVTRSSVAPPPPVVFQLFLTVRVSPFKQMDAPTGKTSLSSYR